MKNINLKGLALILMTIVSGSLFGMEYPVVKGEIQIKDADAICVAPAHFYKQKFGFDTSANKAIDLYQPLVPVTIYLVQGTKVSLWNNDYALYSYLGKTGATSLERAPGGIPINKLLKENKIAKTGDILEFNVNVNNEIYTLQLTCKDHLKSGQKVSFQEGVKSKLDQFKNNGKNNIPCQWMFGLQAPQLKNINGDAIKYDQDQELIDSNVMKKEIVSGKDVLVFTGSYLGQIKELLAVGDNSEGEKNENRITSQKPVGTAELKNIYKPWDKLCVDIAFNKDGKSVTKKYEVEEIKKIISMPDAILYGPEPLLEPYSITEDFKNKFNNAVTVAEAEAQKPDAKKQQKKVGCFSDQKIVGTAEFIEIVSAEKGKLLAKFKLVRENISTMREIGCDTGELLQSLYTGKIDLTVDSKKEWYSVSQKCREKFILAHSACEANKSISKMIDNYVEVMDQKQDHNIVGTAEFICIEKDDNKVDEYRVCLKLKKSNEVSELTGKFPLNDFAQWVKEDSLEKSINYDFSGEKPYTEWYTTKGQNIKEAFEKDYAVYFKSEQNNVELKNSDESSSEQEAKSWYTHPFARGGAALLGTAGVVTSLMYLMYFKSPHYGQGFVSYCSGLVMRMLRKN